MAIVMDSESQRLVQRRAKSVREEGDDLTPPDRSRVLSDRRGRMRLKCIEVNTLVHASCMLRRESVELAGSDCCCGPLALLQILVPA